MMIDEHRIVQVDLKFPPKPIVSSAAKDLISQVKLLTLWKPHLLCISTSKSSFIHVFLYQLLMADASQGFFTAPATVQGT